MTRIKVHNITDHLGVSFDDFSFTVPVPTPTPTPTPTPSPIPTPPSVPTNVIAIPDEEAIALSWTASPGATGYLVRRSGDTVSPSSAKFEALTSESAFTTIAVIPTNTPNFFDQNLSSDITYSYVVAAVGIGGTSLDSEQVSRRPLPRPGCVAQPTPAPNSGNPIPIGHLGWTMNYRLSERDGLVVSDIHMNGRKFAAQISVPYFRLDTFTEGQNSVLGRGELKPNGSSNSDGSLFSRLTEVTTATDANRLLIKAVYKIDRIPGSPKACLNVTQEYEFFKIGFSNPPEWPGPCEPSESVVDCAKFRPMIKYTFHGGDREHLRSLNIPQRHHYEVNGKARNSLGLFRDRDSVRDSVTSGSGFYDRRNPLEKEFWSQIVVNGQNAQKWDNMHQTYKDTIREPSISPGGSLAGRNWYIIGPGCLECVHMHWRWGAFQDYEPFGAGYPLIPPLTHSNQAVDIGVARWKATEDHPFDYATSTIDERERLISGSGLDGVVFWYSPTGFNASDTFFWHTAWLNAKDPFLSSGPLALDNVNGPSSPNDDGPVNIHLGDVFRSGPNTVESFDLSTIGPLPPGYVALNSAAYLITTHALASGPFTIDFRAQSVADQTDFNNLRIFHVEPDPFDPERPVWVDRTVLPPDTPAPDFSTKTLSVRSDDLGVYVIGRLVQVVPPPTDVANLSITSNDSADPITAGSNLTYTMTITNSGPQIAHEVMLRDRLSAELGYVSATASQGSCKEIDGVVYCSLNSLNSGSTVTVTLVVRPIEGPATFPVQGKVVANSATVRAKEIDNNLDNNSVEETTTVMPSPNAAPSVSITSPTTGTLFVGPVTIQLAAQAVDSDGSISNVEFYDNSELVGLGVPSGGNNFVITAPNLSFGPHSFVAVATDNGGRERISNSVNVDVNGPANVSITSPAGNSLLSPGSNVSVSANASHPSGVINKVEFFTNGILLGEGASAGGNVYNLVWANATAGRYTLVAIATDGSGVVTKSAPILVIVDIPPTVAISTPTEGNTFPSITNISVSAAAHSSTTSVAKVDFFANVR